MFAADVSIHGKSSRLVTNFSNDMIENTDGFKILLLDLLVFGYVIIIIISYFLFLFQRAAKYKPSLDQMVGVKQYMTKIAFQKSIPEGNEVGKVL